MRMNGFPVVFPFFDVSYLLVTDFEKSSIEIEVLGVWVAISAWDNPNDYFSSESDGFVLETLGGESSLVSCVEVADGL